MKDIFRFLSLAVVMFAFVACGGDNSDNVEPVQKPKPEPTPSEIKSYTIMTYGCGGRELDEYYEAAIKVVTQLDVPSHINIVGQMKWSNGYSSEWSTGNGEVTRFKYNHSTEMYDNEYLCDNSFKIDDSSNLVAFIEWAREVAPADQYVIIFMGHGNAYHPGFEGGITRAIMRDDEEVANLGLNAIAEAFEAADAHFGLTSLMCCLMNSVEYVTEIEPYSNYYLASNHVTSISGGEIYLMVESLIGMETYDETSIAVAATYAIAQDYDMWWSNNILAIDHTLTRCRDIAKLNSTIRDFTDVVVSLYDEQKRIGEEAMNDSYGFTTDVIDGALGSAYYPANAMLSQSDIDALEWYRLNYAFDIVDIVSKVAKATKHQDIVRAADDVKNAAAEAIVYQRFVNVVDVDSVYYTAMLINKSQWTTLNVEAAGYEDTAFDKATGWSRLLKVNNASYMHCR